MTNYKEKLHKDIVDALQDSYLRGRAEERERLAGVVEGLRKETCDCEETLGYHSAKECDFAPFGYNQALDDLLTSLGCPDEDGCAENPLNLPPFQEEARCCDGCVVEKDMGVATLKGGCCRHKPRTEVSQGKHVHSVDCGHCAHWSFKEGCKSCENPT